MTHSSDSPIRPAAEPWMIRLAYLGLLALLGWTAYGSALSYPFMQDDFEVLRRSQVHNAADVFALFTERIPFVRPISTSVYFGLGQLVWGLSAWAFHAFNLAAYLVSAWFVSALGTRLFQAPRAGYAAGVVFLTTCGHLLGIYWICVMTQGALVFWFLAAWYCDRRAWESGSIRWRVASVLAFVCCTFSNITGPTLAGVITLSAWLLPPRPAWRDLLKQHWPFYASGLALAIVQFVVVGWQSYPNYGVGGGDGGILSAKLQYLANFARFAVSPLYAGVALAADHPWRGFLVTGLLIVCACALMVWRALKHSPLQRTERMSLLVLGALILIGVAPYLLLRDHFHPSHISISSVGLAMMVGWMCARATPRWLGTGVLFLWLGTSLYAIRAYERIEGETQGIGWKAELSRNVVRNIGEILQEWPQTRQIVIVNPNEHLLWFFSLGRIQETHFHRPDVVVSDGASGVQDFTPAPDKVVVRFENQSLVVVQPPTVTAR